MQGKFGGTKHDDWMSVIQTKDRAKNMGNFCAVGRQYGFGALGLGSNTAEQLVFLPNQTSPFLKWHLKVVLLHFVLIHCAVKRFCVKKSNLTSENCSQLYGSALYARQ